MTENLQKQFVDKTDVAMAACLSRLSDEQSSVMLRSEKNTFVNTLAILRSHKYSETRLS